MSNSEILRSLPESEEPKNYPYFYENVSKDPQRMGNLFVSVLKEKFQFPLIIRDGFDPKGNSENSSDFLSVWTDSENNRNKLRKIRRELDHFPQAVLFDHSAQGILRDTWEPLRVGEWEVQISKEDLEACFVLGFERKFINPKGNPELAKKLPWGVEYEDVKRKHDELTANKVEPVTAERMKTLLSGIVLKIFAGQPTLNPNYK